jgi:hypothetical protein
MSYAGVYGESETCFHDRYWRSCDICSNPHAVKAMKTGQTHYDNGSGWCVGCPIEKGACSTRIAHCPVLNTPEQIKRAKHNEHLVKITYAEAQVQEARTELLDRLAELDRVRLHG